MILNGTVDPDVENLYILTVQACDPEGFCTEARNLSIIIREIDDPPVWTPDSVTVYVQEEQVWPIVFFSFPDNEYL